MQQRIDADRVHKRISRHQPHLENENDGLEIEELFVTKALMGGCERIVDTELRTEMQVDTTIDLRYDWRVEYDMMPIKGLESPLPGLDRVHSGFLPGP